MRKFAASKQVITKQSKIIKRRCKTMTDNNTTKDILEIVKRVIEILIKNL